MYKSKTIKEIFYYFLGTILLFLFIPLIERFIDEFVSLTIFESLKSSYYLDILVVILTLLVSGGIYYFSLKSFSKKVAYASILILIFYIYERVSNSHYDFEPFKFYNKLK